MKFGNVFGNKGWDESHRSFPIWNLARRHIQHVSRQKFRRQQVYTCGGDEGRWPLTRHREGYYYSILRAPRLGLNCPAFIRGCLMLPDIITCPMCRTVYERRKERRPEKERGSFACSCGHLIARWNSFVVPIFTLWMEAREL